MERPEERLPAAILERSSLRGNEYAWRLNDIPSVIEAARAADFVSVGGQLQLRLPDGGTCECYWLEVDTFNAAGSGLPWSERVAKAASEASKQFEELNSSHDLLSEAQAAFPSYAAALESDGLRVADALWFVWYVEDRPSP